MLVTARWLLATKAKWDPAKHPRDPRTGRFISRSGTSGGNAKPKPKPAARTPRKRKPTLTGTRALITEARTALPSGPEDWWRQRTRRTPGPHRKIDLMVGEQKRRIARIDAEIAKADETDSRRAGELRYQRGVLIGRLKDLVAIRDRLDAGTSSRLEQAAYGKHEEGDLVELDYRRDPHGAPLPPETYERHLDKVLDVGKAVHDLWQDKLANDPEYRRLVGQHARLRKEWEAASIRDVPVASQRMRAARREQVTREQQLLMDVLGKLRGFGGRGHTDVTVVRRDADADARHEEKAARYDARQRLSDAERFFPRDWLNLSAQRPLTLVTADRAHHRKDRDGIGTTLAMSPETQDRYRYGGAMRDFTEEVTVHELGHRMEEVVPGLKALEYTYVYRRSLRGGRIMEDPRRMNDLLKVSHYDPTEVAFQDQWSDPYAGKTYGGPLPDDPASLNWEVFTTGLQDVFGRTGKHFGDRESEQFTLGVLATLGHKATGDR